MDLLRESAVGFCELMEYQYHFKIARKNILKEFILNFEKEDFYHLAGLHKLKDVSQVQNRKHAIVFQNIIDGKITQDTIKNSDVYNDVSCRLMPLINLKNSIENNQIVFQYIENNIKFSRIQADYLVEYANKPDVVFLFLRERNKEICDDITKVCCESIFTKSKERDFTIGQPVYTLLYKSKIDLSNNSEKILYDYQDLKLQMQNAKSESERKSIKNKLNENLAKLDIEKMEVVSLSKKIENIR